MKKNMQKKKIRQSMIGIRSRVNERFYKEREILKRLRSLKINKAEIISGYMPNKSEVNIVPFLDDLCKRKYNVCLPFINKIHSPLLFKEWISDTTKMINGKFKILVPDNEVFLEPSFVIVPLVAFDIKKNRIGYGGGYYDRTISCLKKKRKIFTIGVAFDEQEIEMVPMMEFDKKLDLIITPTRNIE
ncbi:MAG: 5-formyltetrahydrofolate cyclo-ligase [Rickettsiales bacterium]|nr:5-formyltetrahydrofolate cyclo-ligase [Rickettsiales bacterium]